MLIKRLECKQEIKRFDFALFVFVCIFLGHNIRKTPVQTSREKSPGNSFYFVLIYRKSNGIGISPRLCSAHRFLIQEGKTVKIKPKTKGNYHSGRQFEIFDKSPTNK